VVERGLLELKTLTLMDRNYSKEEKDIYQLLKPLARFNSKEEHEELINNIIEERRLKQKI